MKFTLKCFIFILALVVISKSNTIYARPFGQYSIGSSKSRFSRQVKMNDLLQQINQKPFDEKISRKLFEQKLARKVLTQQLSTYLTYYLHILIDVFLKDYRCIQFEISKPSILSYQK